MRPRPTSGASFDTEDVGGELSKLLDGALRADSDIPVSYSDDIEPWLGERVGGFVSDATPEPQGAVVLETTDRDAAEEALDKVVGSGAESATHGGVEYRIKDGAASAIVADSVVIGTERGVEAAIDASEGSSLAEDADYEQTLEGLDEDRLAHFYLDGAGSSRSSRSPSGRPTGASSRSFGGSARPPAPCP